MPVLVLLQFLALAFFPFFAVSISRALSNAGFLGYQRIVWPGRTMPLPCWFKMMISIESYFFPAEILSWMWGFQWTSQCWCRVGFGGGCIVNGKWCNGLHKLPEVLGDWHVALPWAQTLERFTAGCRSLWRWGQTEDLRALFKQSKAHRLKSMAQVHLGCAHLQFAS